MFGPFGQHHSFKATKTKFRERSQALRGLLFSILPILSFTLTTAAAPVVTSPPLSKDYLLRRWDMDNGLPHITVRSLMESASGELLIGTLAGVAELDGERTARRVPIDISPGTPLSYCMKLVFTANGDLWIATRGGVLRRNARNESRFYSEGIEGLVESLSQATSGAFFLATEHGIHKLQNDRVTKLPFPPWDHARSGIWHVLADGAGDVWVWDDRHLGRLEGDRWVPGPLFTEGTNSVNGVSISKRGGVWISELHGLYRVQNGRVVEKLSFPPDFEDPLTSVLEDSTGKLWVGGFYSGLIVYHPDGTVQRILERQGLTHTHITALLEDREGNIFVATGGAGVLQLTPRRFTSYATERQDSSDNMIRSLTSGPDGTITFVTESSILCDLKPGKGIEVKSLPTPIRGTAVLRSHNGTLWIGTEDDGLYQWNEEKLTKLPDPELGSATIRALFEDSQGGLWIGAKDGYVHQTPDGKRHRFSDKQYPDLADIRDFTEVRAGEVFFSSIDQLYTERNGRPERIPLPPSMNGLPIAAIAAEPSGDLWISSRSGGFVWRSPEGTMRSIEPGKGIPNFTLSTLIVDDEGALWAGSFFGVYRFHLDDLRLRALNPNLEVTHNAFNHHDGLAVDDSRSLGKPGVVKSKDGRLWFASARGVATVNPLHLRIHSPPPPIRIHDLTAQGKSFTAVGSKVSLPAGTRRVVARVSLASLTVPERVKFQYQTGTQDHWSEMGPGGVLELDGLRPGKHPIRVRACNTDGIWTREGGSLDLIIAPFVWETLWFQIGLAVLASVSLPCFVLHLQRRRLRIQSANLAREQALNEERARSSAVIEATSDLVLFADHDQNVFFMNNAGRRLLQLSTEGGIEGLTVASILSASHRADWSREMLPMALRSGLWGTQTVLQSRTGEEIPVTVVVMAHRDSDSTQAVRFLSVVCRDLRELLQIENAKRSAEDRLQLVAENIPACLAYLDSALRPRWLNRTFSSLLGYEGVPLPQQPLPEILPATASAEAAGYLEKARAGAEVRFDWKREGTPAQLFEMHCVPHLNKDGVVLGVFVVCLDITQRKEQEQMRSTLEIQLAQARKMESLGTLAGGIAHDFNNILAAIAGNTRLALEDLAPGHPAEDSLREIQKSSKRASGLVRQILTFSRQQTPQMEQLELRPLVEEAVSLLRINLPPNITLQTVFFKGAPQIVADATQIHQIVINLGTNAIHAMKELGGTLTFVEQLVEVKNTSGSRHEMDLKPGSYLSLEVRDTGVGIDRETLTRIFDPFFTTKGPNEGTGLGLSVVHGIVQKLGGRISVESEPGCGTTFTLLFPTASALSAPVQKVPPRSEKGSGQHILVVDDEEAVVALTSRVLQKLGYRATSFLNPLEAWKEFEKDPENFDMMITDLAMPYLPGDQLAEKVLALRPDFPVILTSGFLRPDDQNKAIRLGIRQVMLKPATLDELGDALSKAFQRRKTIAGNP